LISFHWHEGKLFCIIFCATLLNVTRKWWSSELYILISFNLSLLEAGGLVLWLRPTLLSRHKILTSKVRNNILGFWYPEKKLLLDKFVDAHCYTIQGTLHSIVYEYYIFWNCNRQTNKTYFILLTTNVNSTIRYQENTNDSMISVLFQILDIYTVVINILPTYNITMNQKSFAYFLYLHPSSWNPLTSDIAWRMCFSL
jgi:hypothetical protein